MSELPLQLPPPYRLIVVTASWGLDGRELGLLPLWRFADPDALVVLWTPTRQLPAGLAVLEAWGFEYNRLWVWVKPGHTRAEVALVGVRGDPFRHQRKGARPRDVFLGRPPAGGLGPDQVFKTLDRLFPRGNRLELFGSRPRPGWTCIGPTCPTPADVWDSLARIVPVDPRQGVLWPMGRTSPWRRAEQTILGFANEEGGECT